MSHSFTDAADWFASFGARLRSQQQTDWAGPFRLPDVVATMFLELGPDNASVPTCGNSVFLPSLSELWEFQAGYRYHGLTGEDLADWPDELLVVGHQGGDPIAIDRTLGAVYFARHGSGLWRFESLSDSLAAAVIGIGVLGSIVHEAGPDLCDDDSIVRSEHVDDAVERLSKLMGTDNAHQMLRWAEWML